MTLTVDLHESSRWANTDYRRNATARAVEAKDFYALKGLLAEYIRVSRFFRVC